MATQILSFNETDEIIRSNDRLAKCLGVYYAAKMEKEKLKIQNGFLEKTFKFNDKLKTKTVDEFLVRIREKKQLLDEQSKVLQHEKEKAVLNKRSSQNEIDLLNKEIRDKKRLITEKLKQRFFITKQGEVIEKNIQLRERIFEKMKFEIERLKLNESNIDPKKYMQEEIHNLEAQLKADREIMEKSQQQLEIEKENSRKKKELEQLEEDLIRKEDEIQLKKITFNKERNQFHVDSENYYRMKLEIAKYKRRMNGEILTPIDN